MVNEEPPTFARILSGSWRRITVAPLCANCKFWRPLKFSSERRAFSPILNKRGHLTLDTGEREIHQSTWTRTRRSENKHADVSCYFRNRSKTSQDTVGRVRPLPVHTHKISWVPGYTSAGGCWYLQFSPTPSLHRHRLEVLETSQSGALSQPPGCTNGAPVSSKMKSAAENIQMVM